MQTFPYFDAHCDTLRRCVEEGWDLFRNPGHLDLERLSAYAPMGQVFALYHDGASAPPAELFASVRAQADCFRRAKERHGELMERCVLSLEGAELIGCDERRLEEVKGWGVRWINLTWNHPNALAAPHTMDRGLTEAGRSFARRARELGIYIDVSHLSDRGFWALMELDGGAVVASHSNSRALCPHSRNLTDDMAREIFRRGGFVGVNFCTYFLGEHPTVDTVAAHIEHFLELGGENCIGLGSDFDGADVPEDLSGVEDLPNLWEALCRRNYPEALVEKIFYRNLHQFLQ